jgi:protein-disulfide isomerase
MVVKRWLDLSLTSLLIVCALITTGALVRREFLQSPASSAPAVHAKPALVADWRKYLSRGYRLGSDEAKVQLIEFADFECPACARFHATLKTIQDRYPKEVAIVFMHYPLDYHRFAELAARVADCADEQGRFDAMHDLLFLQQHQFGLKPWSDFAAEAGVPDLARFESCVKQPREVEKIAEGKKAGNEIDIEGTPTLLVNGWKLTSLPDVDSLDQMIQRALSDLSPIE